MYLLKQLVEVVELAQGQLQAAAERIQGSAGRPTISLQPPPQYGSVNETAAQ